MLNGGGNDFELDSESVLYSVFPKTSNISSTNNFKTYRRTQSSDNCSLRPKERLIPIDYRLVATRTRFLQSTVIDLRPQRTVHVTNCCKRLCGATHCGLSTVLPLYNNFENNNSINSNKVVTNSVDIPIHYQKPPIKSLTTADSTKSTVYNKADSATSLQTALDSLDQLINEALNFREDMEGRSSTQWRSSFESTRMMFKNDHNRPQSIKLGGINATSTNSIDIFVDDHKYTESNGATENGRHTPTSQSPLSPKTRVFRSRSAHSMESVLSNGLLDDMANNNHNNLSVNKDFGQSHSHSKSPTPSLNSGMSEFWMNSLAQPKSDFNHKSSNLNISAALSPSEGSKGGTFGRLKILDENQSRFDKLFESFVNTTTAQKTPSPTKQKTVFAKAKSEDFDGAHNNSRPMSFSELDSIIEDIKATGKQLEQVNGKRNISLLTEDVEKLLTSTSIMSNSLTANSFSPGSTDSRISSQSPDDPYATNGTHNVQYTIHHHHHHQHHSMKQKGHHNQGIKEMFQMDAKFPRSSLWRSLATGAVAERVQQFDKSSPAVVANKTNDKSSSETSVVTSAPDVLDSLRNALAEASGQLSPYPSNLVAQQKSASVSVVLPSTSSSSISTSVISTKQNEARKRSVQKSSQPALPKFYFPNGRPFANDDSQSILQKVAVLFEAFSNKRAKVNDMIAVCKACDLPQYLKKHLFTACGGRAKGFLTFHDFSKFWSKFSNEYTSDAAKFVKLVSPNNENYLVADDFIPIIQDIVDTHVGLTFLREAPEFHSRYVHTVVARIFYTVNRSWTGKITADELAKSTFIQTLKKLDEVEDINLITDFFSYEHFYVIYCKFWELDRDHDLLIDKDDLARHNDFAISSRMVDRIFSGAVTKGGPPKNGKMTYSDFVWFLLSEEDKRNTTSIEYWFRCMDIDGDGIISMYELEYFYEEQAKKLELTGVEPMPFLDVVCQMLDIVKPRSRERITLSDLKRCKMCPIFFDTFFNMEKYLEHEQREAGGVAARSDLNDNLSDWERYASEEYDALVAEEQGAGETEIHCDDSDEDFNGQALSKSAPESDLKSAISNASYL